MSVTVQDESGAGVDVERLTAAARHLLAELRQHPDSELSVRLVDEAEMTRLHERWMDEPGPTDVLAFPMDELRVPAPGDSAVAGLLGDVVICPQVAAAQASAARHPAADELDLLLTHGLLHLLGHDHGEPDERHLMFGLQDRLLTSLAAWRTAAGAG